MVPMTYYEKAIAEIKTRFDEPTFFVFSDEMSFARENLPDMERVVFVDHNGEDSAVEDLRLMAACRHHIIANSTFSWWGAWLNPREDKIVIAPDGWVGATGAPPDLLPPEWIFIPA